MARLLGAKIALVSAVMLMIVSPTPGWATFDVVQVDTTHYSGKWLEIGRTPMFITDGCVAG